MLRIANSRTVFHKSGQLPRQRNLLSQSSYLKEPRKRLHQLKAPIPCSRSSTSLKVVLQFLTSKLRCLLPSHLKSAIQLNSILKTKRPLSLRLLLLEKSQLLRRSKKRKRLMPLLPILHPKKTRPLPMTVEMMTRRIAI